MKDEYKFFMMRKRVNECNFFMMRFGKKTGKDKK